MMSEENRSAVSAPCSFSKKCVARFTRRSFDRHLPFLPERTHICGTEFELNVIDPCTTPVSLAGPRAWQTDRLCYKFSVVPLHQRFHKPRIGIAEASAQLMIQMAYGQLFVTEAD